MNARPKPSDFDISSDFSRSPLEMSHLEVVARNIVELSMRMGDDWHPFSLEAYQKAFGYDERELGELDSLGLIQARNKKKKKNIEVLPLFFDVFRKFVKKH